VALVAGGGFRIKGRKECGGFLIVDCRLLIGRREEGADYFPLSIGKEGEGV
jgi:hypothetical protein